MPRARRTLDVGTASPEPHVATVPAGKDALVAAEEEGVVDEDVGASDVDGAAVPVCGCVLDDGVSEGAVAADG